MRTGAIVLLTIAALVLLTVSAGEADAGEPVRIHSTAPDSEAWVDAEIGAELPREWVEVWASEGPWVLSDGSVWNPYDPWSNYILEDGIIEITPKQPDPPKDKDNSAFYWIVGFTGIATLLIITYALLRRH